MAIIPQVVEFLLIREQNKHLVTALAQWSRIFLFLVLVNSASERDQHFESFRGRQNMNVFTERDSI